MKSFKFFIFSVLFALGGVCLSSPPITTTVGTTTQSMLPKEYSITFPVHRRDDLLIFNISTQNQIMRLMFDTGAAHFGFAITRSFVEPLNVVVSNKISKFRDFQGAPLNYHEIIIPNLSIDNISFNSVRGVLLDKTQGTQDSVMYTVDGVVGPGFFASVADYLLVNFQEGYIKIFKGFPPDVDLNEFAKIKFDDTGGFIHSRFIVNSKPLMGIWDYGTNYALINGNQGDHMMPLSARACQGSDEDLSTCRYMDATIASDQFEQLGVTPLYFKNFFPMFDIDVILGNTFFRDKVVVFDFKDHYVYVKKITTSVLSRRT